METSELGKRQRDMIFRMNTWAKQRANLQFIVEKLLKTRLSCKPCKKGCD